MDSKSNEMLLVAQLKTVIGYGSKNGISEKQFMKRLHIVEPEVLEERIQIAKKYGLIIRKEQGMYFIQKEKVKEIIPSDMKTMMEKKGLINTRGIECR